MTVDNAPSTAHVLVAYLSQDRLSTYIQARDGDLTAALALYHWNSAVAGAFWESLGHVEVVLRNALCDRLAARHARRGRPSSWLDDPAGDLDQRAVEEVARARRRVRAKGKRVTEGQVVAELGFGFWRFLIARRYMALWPDLASAFPHAPDRRQQTIEAPVARLYVLRNRLAHHERVWNQPLADRYRDLLALLGYIDRDVRDWVAATSRIQATLASQP